MNKQRMLKTCAVVEAHAAHFDMATYGYKTGTVSILRRDESKCEHDCNTEACYASFADALFQPPKNHQRLFGVSHRAAVILGLSYADDEEVPLFHTESWPVAFARVYSTAKHADSRVKAARVLTARVQFYIATRGTDALSDYDANELPEPKQLWQVLRRAGLKVSDLT